MKSLLCKIFGHKIEWVRWKQNTVPTGYHDKTHLHKYTRKVCKRCGAVLKDSNDLFGW
jgi:hypothetical protein